jgi:hypothetical protein
MKLKIIDLSLINCLQFVMKSIRKWLKNGMFDKLYIKSYGLYCETIAFINRDKVCVSSFQR